MMAMKRYLQFHVAIAVLSVCAGQVVIPTIAQRDAAKDKIVEIINANTEAINDGRNHERHPFRAGFVRLAFHDCVHGTGHTPKACDGCVNHPGSGGNNENAGLKRYTDELDAAYGDATNGISSSMSHADFYTLAGVVALDEAAEPGSTVNQHFAGLNTLKFGRKDPDPTTTNYGCDNINKDTAADFLSPFVGRMHGPNGIAKFFQHRFGFSTQDSVAILGAHTLGEAKNENSGFEGRWATAINSNGAQSDFLNNRYYKHIAGDWEQINRNEGNGGKLQWKRGEVGGGAFRLMLNVDMAVAWDLTNAGTENPAQNAGEVDSCVINVEQDQQGAKEPGFQTCEEVPGSPGYKPCCPKSPDTNKFNDPQPPNPWSSIPTAAEQQILENENLFYRYATNNVRWIAEFKEAYFKMIFNDAQGLQAPLP